MEQLLTIEQIHTILSMAKKPPYQMSGVIGSFDDGDPLTIAFISIKGLIFIHGNRDTGLNHITDRHGYHSRRSDWVLGKEKMKIDNPSKFTKHTRPILDYRLISDVLYKPENAAESKRPGQFEKYTGFFASIKYHLILYHGTKIVHTLYPDKKTFNKKKDSILHYRQTELIIEYSDLRSFIIGKYSYVDTSEIERYVIVFRLDNDSHIQQIFVQLNYTDGRPFYSEKVSEVEGCRMFTPEEYFFALENTDLTKIERAINRFDKETFGKTETL